MTVGSSQSGAFIHGLIFYGFNEDEDGRIVFDGAWPQIDGRMMTMNYRWGQPETSCTFTWAATKHRSGGPTIRTWRETFRQTACCTAARDRTCPQILETFGSAEMYSEKFAAAFAASRALPTSRCRRTFIDTIRLAPPMAAAPSASTGPRPIR